MAASYFYWSMTDPCMYGMSIFMPIWERKKKFPNEAQSKFPFLNPSAQDVYISFFF